MKAPSLKAELAFDARTPRFRNQRPERRETYKQIIAVANAAALTREKQRPPASVGCASWTSKPTALPAKFVEPAASAPVSNWNAKRTTIVGAKR